MAQRRLINLTIAFYLINTVTTMIGSHTSNLDFWHAEVIWHDWAKYIS